MSFLYSFFSGESVKDVIVLTGQDDNLDGVRRLLHQSILHANVVGMPKGQALTSTSTGMIFFLSCSLAICLVISFCLSVRFAFYFFWTKSLKLWGVYFSHVWGVQSAHFRDMSLAFG